MRRSTLVIIQTDDVNSAISGPAHNLNRILKPYVDGVIITVAKTSTRPFDERVRIL